MAEPATPASPASPASPAAPRVADAVPAAVPPPVAAPRDEPVASTMADAPPVAPTGSAPSGPTDTDGYDALATEAEQGDELIPYEVPGRDLTVHLLPMAQLPGKMLLDMGSVAARKSQAEQFKIISDFLDNVVAAKDRDRFEALMMNARPPLLLPELNEIVEGMIEAIGGRPS